MKTRREFLAGGAALAAMVASGKPIRSSLGADNVVKSAAGWSNPYVTDGLIAMWDAEWNAGGGVHDSINRIVNLCEGNPIVLTESASIGEKIVSFTTSSTDIADADGLYYGGKATDVDGLPNAGDAITTECVAAVPNTGAWANLAFGYIYRNGNHVSNSYQQFVTCGAFFTSGNAYYVSKQGPAAASQTISTTCRPLSWNSAEIFFNGNDGASTSAFRHFRPDTTVGILVANYIGAQISFNSMRIYNRCLTSDEVAANYAVDKERFGLP